MQVQGFEMHFCEWGSYWNKPGCNQNISTLKKATTPTQASQTTNDTVPIQSNQPGWHLICYAWDVAA